MRANKRYIELLSRGLDEDSDVEVVIDPPLSPSASPPLSPSSLLRTPPEPLPSSPSSLSNKNKRSRNTMEGNGDGDNNPNIILTGEPARKEPRTNGPATVIIPTTTMAANFVEIDPTEGQFRAYHVAKSNFRFPRLPSSMCTRFNNLLRFLAERRIIVPFEEDLEKTTKEFKKHWVEGVNAVVSPFVRTHFNEIETSFDSLARTLEGAMKDQSVVNLKSFKEYVRVAQPTQGGYAKFISTFIMFISGLVCWDAEDDGRIFGRLNAHYFRINGTLAELNATFGMHGQLSMDNVLDITLKIRSMSDTKSFCFFSHPSWWFYVYPFDTFADQTHNTLLLALLNQSNVTESERLSIFKVMQEEGQEISLVEELIEALIVGYHMEKASAIYRGHPHHGQRWDSLLHHQLFHLERPISFTPEGNVDSFTIPHVLQESMDQASPQSIPGPELLHPLPPSKDMEVDYKQASEAKERLDALVEQYNNGFIIQKIIEVFNGKLPNNISQSDTLNLKRHELLRVFLECLALESHPLAKAMVPIDAMDIDNEPQETTRIKQYANRRQEIGNSIEMRAFILTFAESLAKHTLFQDYANLYLTQNEIGTSSTTLPMTPENRTKYKRDVLQIIETLEWNLIENMIDRIALSYTSTYKNADKWRRLVATIEEHHPFLLSLATVSFGTVYRKYINGFGLEGDRSTYNLENLDLSRKARRLNKTESPWPTDMQDTSMDNINQYGLASRLRMYSKLTDRLQSYKIFYDMFHTGNFSMINSQQKDIIRSFYNHYGNENDKSLNKLLIRIAWNMFNVENSMELFDQIVNKDIIQNRGNIEILYVLSAEPNEVVQLNDELKSIADALFNKNGDLNTLLIDQIHTWLENQDFMRKFVAAKLPTQWGENWERILACYDANGTIDNIKMKAIMDEMDNYLHIQGDLFMQYFTNSTEGTFPFLETSWETVPALNPQMEFSVHKTLQLINMVHDWTVLDSDAKFSKISEVDMEETDKKTKVKSIKMVNTLVTYNLSPKYGQQVLKKSTQRQDSMSRPVTQIEKLRHPRFYYPYTPLMESNTLHTSRLHHPFMRSLRTSNVLNKEYNMVIACIDLMNRMFLSSKTLYPAYYGGVNKIREKEIKTKNDDLVEYLQKKHEKDDRYKNLRVLNVSSGHSTKIFDAYNESVTALVFKNKKKPGLTQAGRNKIEVWTREDLFDLLKSPVASFNTKENTVTDDQKKEWHAKHGYVLQKESTGTAVVAYGGTSEVIKQRLNTILHLLPQCNVTHVPFPSLPAATKMYHTMHGWNQLDSTIMLDGKIEKYNKGLKVGIKTSSENVTEKIPASIVGSQIYKVLSELHFSSILATAYWKTYSNTELLDPFDALVKKQEDPKTLSPKLYKAIRKFEKDTKAFEDRQKKRLDSGKDVGKESPPQKPMEPPAIALQLIQDVIGADVEHRLQDLNEIRASVHRKLASTNGSSDMMNILTILDFKPIQEALQYISNLLSSDELVVLIASMATVSRAEREKWIRNCESKIENVKNIVQLLQNFCNDMQSPTVDHANKSMRYEENLNTILYEMLRLKLDLLEGNVDFYQPIFVALMNMVGAVSDILTHFNTVNYVLLHNTIFSYPLLPHFENPDPHTPNVKTDAKIAFDKALSKPNGVAQYLAGVVKNLFKSVPLNMANCSDLSFANDKTLKELGDLNDIPFLLRVLKMRMYPHNLRDATEKKGYETPLLPEIHSIYTKMINNPATSLDNGTLLPVFDSISMILTALDLWCKDWMNSFDGEIWDQPLFALAILSSIQTFTDWENRTWFSQNITKEKGTFGIEQITNSNRIRNRDIMAIPFSLAQGGLDLGKSPKFDAVITAEDYDQQYSASTWTNTSIFNVTRRLAQGPIEGNMIPQEEITQMQEHLVDNIIDGIDRAIKADAILLPWTLANRRFIANRATSIDSTSTGPNSVTRKFTKNLNNTIQDQFVIPPYYHEKDQSYNDMIRYIHEFPHPIITTMAPSDNLNLQVHQHNLTTVDPFIHSMRNIRLSDTLRDTYTNDKHLWEGPYKEQINKRENGSLDFNMEMSHIITGHNGISQLLQHYTIMKMTIANIKKYRDTLIAMLNDSTVVNPMEKVGEVERQRNLLENILDDHTLHRLDDVFGAFDFKLRRAMNIVRRVPDIPNPEQEQEQEQPRYYDPPSPLEGGDNADDMDVAPNIDYRGFGQEDAAEEQNLDNSQSNLLMNLLSPPQSPRPQSPSAPSPPPLSTANFQPQTLSPDFTGALNMAGGSPFITMATPLATFSENSQSQPELWDFDDNNIFPPNSPGL